MEEQLGGIPATLSIVEFGLIRHGRPVGRGQSMGFLVVFKRPYDALCFWVVKDFFINVSLKN